MCSQMDSDSWTVSGEERVTADHMINHINSHGIT